MKKRRKKVPYVPVITQKEIKGVPKELRSGWYGRFDFKRKKGEMPFYDGLNAILPAVE